MTETSVILREATPEDCRFYWTVNNAPTTRAQSITTDPIPWDSHARWYPARLADPATALYVAESGGDRVGVVRFDLAGEEATISVALAPEHQGKGLGRRVIAEATQTTLALTGATRAIALIRPDNVGSVRAFEAAGYVLDGRQAAGDTELLRYTASG